MAVGRPLAVAVTCTVSGPVWSPLSTSVAVKVADSDRREWSPTPAASVPRCCRKPERPRSSWSSVPPSVTVPVIVWPSQPEAGKVSVRVRSLSKTMTVAVPAIQLSMEAVTVTSDGERTRSRDRRPAWP